MSLGPGRGSDSAVRVRLQELKNKLCCLIDNTDEIESLLTSILSTLQSGTEYEAKIVVDNCDSGKLYLEVRVYDTDSGTWGPTTYYTPGSSTPVVPVGLGSDCLQYSDSTSVLSQIQLDLQPKKRKANVERVSTTWNNIENVFSFSVANVGTEDGTVLGATIKPGEIVNFNADTLNNFFDINSISIDGTSTELLLTFITPG